LPKPKRSAGGKENNKEKIATPTQGYLSLFDDVQERKIVQAFVEILGKNSNFQLEMKIGLIGASGYVGQRLAVVLKNAGYHIVGFSRSPQAQKTKREGIMEWRSSSGGFDFSGIEAVINLAGEGIDRRWTDSAKKLFYDSRVGVTERIVGSLEKLSQVERPTILLNASAVGIYGDSGERELHVGSDTGNDYMARLCQQWEEAAQQAAQLGVRVAFLRIGAVFGKGSAAWEQMRLPFSLGLGASLGSGKQWTSWIHEDDLVQGIRHILEDSELMGAVNLVSPNPIRNKDMTRILAEGLSRPAFLKVPGCFLKMIFGGFSSAMLNSYRAKPIKLEESGFQFTYPRLEEAIEEMISS